MPTQVSAAADSELRTVRRSLSLVLPAWNEAEAITRAVVEADEALARVADRYEVIVVDDGSRDDTAAIVADLAQRRPNVRLVRHEVNRGYGAALRTGFAAATCDLVAFTDADSQFDLREMDRLVLLARDYPVVCGYRIDRQDPWLRCFYSRVYNHIVRFLLGTGVRDVDCAMKVFHRDVLPKLPITTSGFLINSEMLSQARSQGIPVVEVGVTHRPRTEGESTVSIHHIPVVFASLLRYWWNKVQFPASTTPAPTLRSLHGESSASERRLAWAQAALLVAAAVFFLWKLDYPLIDRDETRYGEIPREMVESGNWVRPQLNYETYYDKPALLYWLCAISYKVFGVAPWSARLVAPLAGLTTLAATMWLGNRMFGRATSLLAGVVLATSIGFVGASRVLLIDGVLAALMTVSMIAAYMAVTASESVQRSWWLAAATAAGLAFLAKGPIALVLLGPPVLAYSWLNRDTAKVGIRHWTALGAVMALMAAPWFLAVSQQAPDFAYQFFYKHNVQRFGGAYHAQPSWYFFPVLMIGGHPWTFLTLPLLWYLGTRSNVIRATRSPAVGYLALWAGWCLLFFSASKCKLPPYILPAGPALALLAAHFLRGRFLAVADDAWARYVDRWAPRLSVAATCLGGIGIGVFLIVIGSESRPVAYTLIGGWSASLAAIVVFARRDVDPRAAWGAAVAAAAVLGSTVVHCAAPEYAYARTVFGAGSQLAAHRPADTTPVATFNSEWSEIPFNLGRNDVKNFHPGKSGDLRRFTTEHGQVLIVMRRKHDVADVATMLPRGSKVEVVADKGAARLLLVTAGAKGSTVAAKPDDATLNR